MKKYTARKHENNYFDFVEVCVTKIRFLSTQRLANRQIKRWPFEITQNQLFQGFLDRFNNESDQENPKSK